MSGGSEQSVGEGNENVHIEVDGTKPRRSPDLFPVSCARTRASLSIFRPRDRNGRGRATVQEGPGIEWAQGEKQRVEERCFTRGCSSL